MPGPDTMTGNYNPYSQGRTINNNGMYAGMFQNDPQMQSMMNARPGWQSIQNVDGSLGSPYRVGASLGGMSGQADWANATQGLNNLQTMANALGMTPLGQQQDAMMSGAALKSGQDAMGSAMDRMAVQGGVSSGAQERMGTQGMVNEAQQVSGAHNQAMLSDLGFKQNLQTSLPGMYAQQGQMQTQDVLGAENANAAHAIGNVYNQNASNLGAWQTGMETYGNEQVANAQLAAANKENPGLLGQGGVLGTGLGGQHGLLGTGLFSSNGLFNPGGGGAGTGSWGAGVNMYNGGGNVGGNVVSAVQNAFDPGSWR